MSDLYNLYRLHKVDSALHSLKREHETLDIGGGEKAQIEQLERELKTAESVSKAATSEIKDKELEQKSIAEKIAALNKKMFDGSVVSPKEIENMQKEIEMLRALSERHDERLLELYEQAPPLVETTKGLSAKISELKKVVEHKSGDAVKRHEEIKIEYNQLRTKRKALEAFVEKALLAQYDTIRKQTGSTGVADVSEQGACDVCGMSVPSRQRQMLKEDKVTMCEGCHRILFVAVAAE